MTALTGRTPAASYKDLLQVSNSNSGIDTTLRTVSDGEGTDSALQLSTTAANVVGQLDFDTLAAAAISYTAIEVGKILYPVGTYYYNETDATNPATLLGFGTWTAVTDKFIVAKGATYVTTGGAATVTLTEANLPSSVTLGVPCGAVDDAGTSRLATANSSGATTENITVSLGDGTSFSIIPTYQAAYVWKRTA